MKKTKKQSWIEEEGLAVAVVMILMFVALLIVPKYLNSTSYICSKSPEKCVCETPFERFCDFYGNDCSDKCTSQFRLKSQAELDIDDCNSNPREDDLCKCEETKDNLDKPTHGYACPNSCEEITIKECKIHGLYYYNQEINFEGRIIYKDLCELNSIPSDLRITQAKNITMEIVKLNITNCEQCWKYEQICIKSRPKTECEKGNPEWVEENKIDKIDTSITPHHECNLQKGWFCPAIGIVNLPCDNNSGKCYLPSGLNYVGCSYEEEACISKQAWRQKGCSRI